MATIELYHGSSHVIERPTFGLGNPRNDYGLGFYCTETLAMAQEWGCVDGNSGYANKYRLDLAGLDVLDLSQDKGYNVLNWLAVLLDNRMVRLSAGLPKQAAEYLAKVFLPDYRDSDVMRGYRADDSYFDYAESFLNNAISVEQLAAAMKLGKLGEQIVLKSQFAFSRIRFEGFDVAEKEEFYVLRKARDDEANRLYLELLEEESDGLYIQDIIRGGITNDDSRIPRNISE